MQARHEKVIYENDRGKRIEIAYSFPYFLQSINGTDGTNANITKIKGVGQDGTTITNVNLSDRNLQILGSIKGDTKEEIAKHRAKLLQVFNPKVKGWLQYEYGDAKRQIRVQVEKAPAFSKQNRSFKYQDFLIDLIAPNPFWQDISENKTDISTETGNFSFPWGIPPEGTELSIRTISFIANIYNPGDVETSVKIFLRARGTVENPIITNLNTGEYIRVKRNLSEGDTLEINTAFGNKRVEIIKANGERENAFHYIDYKSKFFSIESGDTQIKYDADVGNNNLDVSIYYTPRYLGI